MTAVIVTIAAGMILALFVFNVGSALAGRLFGFPATAFVVGNGPALISTKLGGMQLELRPLPISGRVDFGARSDGATFEVAHPIARIAAALAGPLAVAAIAVLAGGTAMAGEVFRTWPQIVELLTHIGEPAGVLSAIETANAANPIGGIALVMAKVARFNLGPLAFTSGGIVLGELVRLVTGRTVGQGIAKVWLMASLVIAFALVAVLAIKLVTGAV